MSKSPDTINSFCTKCEKYTNEILLENFGLLRRMYSNCLTTENYEHWNWSWSYIIQPAYDKTRFRIIVQFNNLPLPSGHLLAFKAIVYRKNSQITKSSECIGLKEDLWLTNNENILDICSIEELEEFISKDTLRLMIIVRHDWLVKNFRNDNEILLKSNEKHLQCQNKFLNDMKSICNQIETSDVIIRVHNRTYSCHRVILCARSLYFQKLFQSEFREKTCQEIDLSSFITNEYHFELLHSYLYKSECQLNEENIYSYLQLSDQFILDELFELCEEYLLINDHINERNVWLILDMYNIIGRKLSLNIQEKCFSILKTNRHLINEQCHEILKRHPQLSIELVKYFL